MEPIKVGPFAQRFDHVFKLRPDMVDSARANVKKNNADDMFFRIGDDQYVASDGTISSSVKPGQEVVYEGKKGVVTAVDHQSTFFKPFLRAGVAAIIGAAVAPIFKAPPSLGGMIGGMIGWMSGLMGLAKNTEYMRMFADTAQ